MSTYADPRAIATQYLEEHDLFKLFSILAAKLAFSKPEDPNTFLLMELTKLKKMNENNQAVALFDEIDIAAMFIAFDITNRGYVNRNQYLKGLNATGISQPSLDVPTDEKIDKDTFVKGIYREVLNNAFKPKA